MHTDSFDPGAQIVYSQNPSPREIEKHFEMLSQLEQQEASKKYRGIPVEWQVTFPSFRQVLNWQGRFAQILARGGKKHPFPIVSFTIDTEKYPLLENIQYDDVFIVRGVIKEVRKTELVTIELEDVTLIF